MKNYITIFFCVISFVANGEKLEKIEVIEEINLDTPIIKKENFLTNAPMQQQITTKQALDSPGSNGDPLHVIQTLAGVVSASSLDNNEIYIHGSKPRETSVSINQLPLGYLYHLNGRYSVIAPESISQIDAYLGGFGVNYRSMGAVIDVSPKYPSYEKQTGKFHIGMYNADFAYSAPINESTAVFLSARRSYMDFFLKNFSIKDKNNPELETKFILFPQFHDINFILTHLTGNNVFSVESIIAEDQLKLFLNINENTDPAANGKVNRKRGFTTLGFRWRHFGDIFISHTLLSRLYTHMNLELFKDLYLKQTMTQLQLFNENTADFGNHKITFGTTIATNSTPVDTYITSPQAKDKEERQTSKDILRLDTTFKSTSYVLFLEDIMTLSNQDKLRYGFRYSKIDFQAFGTVIDPRIAYVKTLNHNTSISFALGQYSQFPKTLAIVYPFGNPNIDTYEQSEHFVISYQKQLDKYSKLIVEPYIKSFDDLAIEYYDKNNTLKYNNVGSGNAYGVDVTYTKKINNTNIIIAYTFIDAKRQLYVKDDTQYSFTGDVPHTLQVSVKFPINPNWDISSLLKYNTGKPYTPVIGAVKKIDVDGDSYYDPINGKPYSKRLPDTINLTIEFIRKPNNINGTGWEHKIELLSINALFAQDIEAIRYNAKYEEDGYYEGMGFICAYHATYRF